MLCLGFVLHGETAQVKHEEIELIPVSGNSPIGKDMFIQFSSSTAISLQPFSPLVQYSWILSTSYYLKFAFALIA